MTQPQARTPAARSHRSTATQIGLATPEYMSAVFWWSACFLKHEARRKQRRRLSAEPQPQARARSIQRRGPRRTNRATWPGRMASAPSGTSDRQIPMTNLTPIRSSSRSRDQASRQAIPRDSHPERRQPFRDSSAPSRDPRQARPRHRARPAVAR
jgi:hypothetical protein